MFLHRLGKTYGVLPTTLLKLGTDEFELLTEIAMIGNQADIADMKR